MGGSICKAEGVAVVVASEGSNSESARRKADRDNVNKSKWRRPDTKVEARKRYILEGTLPLNCSDKLLELRGFLQEPTLLSRFGKYALEYGSYHVLVCWADILEFKHTDEKSLEYLASQFVHIYDKFIGPDAVCDLTHIIEKMPPSWKTEQEFRYKSIKEGHEQPIPKNVFDVFSHHCLADICGGIFQKFKGTVLYSMSVRELNEQYNRISLDDFEYYDTLGHGSYGFVVHCMKKTTKRHYAMKIQTKAGLLGCFDDAPARVTFEKEAVAKCRHPFIVSLDYAFQTETMALMVMDLGTAGTLQDAAMWTGTGVIEEDRVCFYAAEIILALGHIHKMGLIYRDLKPANVLLNADGHIQLVDLGGIIDVGGKILGYHDPQLENETAGGVFSAYDDLSNHTQESAKGSALTHSFRSRNNNFLNKEVTGKTRNIRMQGGQTMTLKVSYARAEAPKDLKRATSIMGTGGYMAPEMLVMLHQNYADIKGYTLAVDYWSLGVMMFKLLVGTLPFNKNQVESLIHLVNDGNAVDDTGRKQYPPAYAQFYRALSSVKGLGSETMNIIAAFLELDENKRLGSGPEGLKNIKAHPYFKDISWRMLEKKLCQPPFIPEVERDVADEQPFENFQECLASMNKEHWLRSKVSTQEQRFFDTWEYISPAILQVELGLEEEAEATNQTLRLKLTNRGKLKHTPSAILENISAASSGYEHGN